MVKFSVHLNRHVFVMLRYRLILRELIWLKMCMNQWKNCKWRWVGILSCPPHSTRPSTPAQPTPPMPTPPHSTQHHLIQHPYMSVTGQDITSSDDEKKMSAFFFEAVKLKFFHRSRTNTARLCGLGHFGAVSTALSLDKFRKKKNNNNKKKKKNKIK